MLWLVLFFLAARAAARHDRCQLEGSPVRRPEFSWEWSQLRGRVQPTSATSSAGRSCTRRGHAPRRSSSATRSRTCIAFQGGRWKNLLLGLVVVPFFTIVPDPHASPGSRSSATRAPVVGAPRRRSWASDCRLLATPVAVIGGLTYNFLPFMMLPIYVSLEKIDLRLIDAAGDLYSTPVAAFRKVVLPAVAARACSPAACSCSSPPPATSSTPSSSAARRRR